MFLFSTGIFHESLARKGTPSHWLDFAQTRYNGKYSESVVNECKSLLKMAVIFLALIPYWICNAQVGPIRVLIFFVVVITIHLSS